MVSRSQWQQAARARGAFRCPALPGQAPGPRELAAGLTEAWSPCGAVIASGRTQCSGLVLIKEACLTEPRPGSVLEFPRQLPAEA